MINLEKIVVYEDNNKSEKFVTEKIEPQILK